MNNAYIISRLMQERDAAVARADAAEARVARLEGALRHIQSVASKNDPVASRWLVDRAAAALTQEEPTDG
jgi:hypothetical protein